MPRQCPECSTPFTVMSFQDDIITCPICKNKFLIFIETEEVDHISISGDDSSYSVPICNLDRKTH